MNMPNRVNGAAASSQSVFNFQATPEISELVFKKFRDFLYEHSGISLAASKQSMVSARLGKRLRHHGISSFDEYFRMIESGSNTDERQVVLNLLSTNETYFFREPEHFNFLENNLRKPTASNPFRIWSAASSTGEEAYSIAMLLADKLGENAPWEIVGSDISTDVIEKAGHGQYAMQRIDGIPQNYLSRYCLKGTGPYQGSLLVDTKLRQKVKFTQVNLMHPMPALGEFDYIFLRNVLIYFDKETKAKLIPRLTALLKPGGYFIIGHSESLKGICDSLELVGSTTYQKPLK